MDFTTTPIGRRTFIKTAVAGAALGSAGLRAAAAAAPLKPLSFQLSWIKSIQYGGYFGGLEIGSFKEFGVAPTFVSGGPNLDPIANVAAGRSQIGDRPSGALLIARDHGIPIKIIGVVYEKSPYSLLSLASKPIDSIKAMAGKTIAVSVSGRALMAYMLKSGGVDPASVHMVPSSTDPAALAAGQVDGYLGYSTDEGVMLQTRGVKIHVFNASDHGLPDATGVIYGRADYLAANRPLVVSFLRGAVKGWQWALANPAKDAHLMVDKYGAPGLKYVAQHTEIVVSAPYIQGGIAKSKGLLSVDMDMFGKMIDVYRKVGLIKSDMKVTDLCDPSFIDEAHKA